MTHLETPYGAGWERRPNLSTPLHYETALCSRRLYTNDRGEDGHTFAATKPTCPVCAWVKHDQRLDDLEAKLDEALPILHRLDAWLNRMEGR